MPDIEVYLEIGKKRTFAGALSWPGWCRSGKDEAAAVQALYDYGARYAYVLATGVVRSTTNVPHPGVNLRPTPIEFQAPADPSVFVVVERLEGDAATDFGAPGQIPSWDQAAMDEAEFLRSQKLLRASWQAFDAAANAALGKALRTGTRGGGRDLDRLTRHVEEAEAAYLSKLGGKLAHGMDTPQARQLILETMAASAHGEIPATGPRGGQRWTARTFVRRAAWHLLDHAWELEDRII
jgi:hypothetical protein